MNSSRRNLSPFLLAVCCLSIAMLISCNPKKEKQNRSFCFWKTAFELSSADNRMMNQMGVNHLYIRYFDVDWNPYEKEALPVGTINTYWYSSDLKNISFTPCVYITNTVMENASEQQLNELAGRVRSRIESILAEQSDRYKNQAGGPYEEYHFSDIKINKDSLKRVKDSVETFSIKEFENKISEIVIDCDWTEKTKDKYFLFLKHLQELNTKHTISATLRLWQYKDRETSGIPPVKKCLLMCYNLNSPAQYNIKNSICSVDELKKYIKDDTYPISLDVALPIFNSAVIFRNGSFKGMISNVNLADYENDTVNYQKLKDKLFKFKTDQIIGNTVIRYGDELRVEQLKTTELDEIADLLSEKLELDDDSRVTFFSWDTTYINNYGIENIKKYYQLFEH